MEKYQIDSPKIGDYTNPAQNLFDASDSLLERSKQLNEKITQISNRLKDIDTRILNSLRHQQKEKK